MKKIIALISALSMLTVFTVSSYAANYLGDVDKNGEVNSSDALTVLKYSVGLEKEIDVKLADITKDGEINSADALDILKTAVGMLELQLAEEDKVDPLSMDKEQLVNFYNDAMQSSYAQAKMTDKKTEKVSIKLDTIKINGKTASNIIKNLANSFAESKQKDTKETKSFVNGKAADGTTAGDYILPTLLTADGVKSASITAKGTGYRIVINVVPETCDFTAKPNYNSKCSVPLDIKDITGAIEDFADITSAELKYTGTTITADIDAEGRVTFVQVNMPIQVNNGVGVITTTSMGLKGSSVNADAHGEWVCTHTMTF